jgi:putative oxidoreductase
MSSVEDAHAFKNTLPENSGEASNVVEVWIVLSRSVDPVIPIMLATLGAGLAIVGPGAWSIDARLFGRKHIEIAKG